MSRIGNNPITVPEGVNVEIQADSVKVSGKLGTLNQNIDGVSVLKEENQLIIKRNSESKEHKAKHGLYRSLINNMIVGVSQGWKKSLELVGVGYRAQSSGQKLDLSLGFSHNIVMMLPDEIKIETINEKGKNPIINLTSFDKQLVGMVAAKIRSYRKPEPYKGKGVKFVGEEIRRKAGKSA
jgi:large subunit ribosomal protein L6|tara:strand:+ start:9663 stop:10205 length:543 start_codon:yes stop_codon:yes gene_type:complete